MKIEDLLVQLPYAQSNWPLFSWRSYKWLWKVKIFAPDTMEILLINAYHWNPCWKVDEQCIISGCLRCISTKMQLFSYLYFAMTWLFSISIFLFLTLAYGIPNDSESCAITQPRPSLPDRPDPPMVIHAHCQLLLLAITRGRGERRNVLK